MDNELKINVRMNSHKIALLTALDTGIAAGIDQYNRLYHVDQLVGHILQLKEDPFYTQEQWLGRKTIGCKNRIVANGINLYLKKEAQYVF